MKERDLKARGSKISVTDENKIEYVELMTQWRLERVSLTRPTISKRCVHVYIFT